MSHACHRFWTCYKTLTFCSLLTRCTIPCACHAKRHFEVQKKAPTCGAFNILTSKGASRYNGVHFVDIALRKCASRHNGVHFLDSSTSKSARNVRCIEVLLAFSLANVLRATTACNFSSLIWPAGSAPAALASLLFDPPEPQIIGKTQCFGTFLPFRAPGSSFFWDFLFSDLLSSSLLFSILLLHHCFSSVHVVGNLTSKLPSIIYRYENALP